jgi:hypothetical protein
LRRKTAHPLHGFVVIDRLKVLAQRLAADGDAVFDDFGGFAVCKRISLNGIRGVGQLDIVIFLELCEDATRQWAQSVQLRLLFIDTSDKGRKHFAIIPASAHKCWRGYACWTSL